MEALIGLIGVVLGFLLSEGYSAWKDKKVKKEYKEAINAELKSLKGQIPQLKDICNQAIASLRSEKFLPPLGVPAITQAYDNFGSKIQPDLNPLERNCLHIIYGRLKVSDKVLAELENDFRIAVAEGVFDNPFEAFIDKISDISESYDLVNGLIDSFLSSKPIDVFQIKKLWGRTKLCS